MPYLKYSLVPMADTDASARVDDSIKNGYTRLSNINMLLMRNDSG